MARCHATCSSPMTPAAFAVTDALGTLTEKVTVIRLDKNAGPGGARNAALGRVLAADYKYVAIMDADDVSHPTRLAVQQRF